METQAPKFAPAPKSGLQLVIYNVLRDAGKALAKDALWKAMPSEVHKPFGLRKFSKALGNMCVRGTLVNVSPKTRVGIYRVATAEEHAARKADLSKRKAKSYRKSKKKKSKANGSGKRTTSSEVTSEVIGRIDARIAELEGRLSDLKALKGLIREVRL